MTDQVAISALEDPHRGRHLLKANWTFWHFWTIAFRVCFLLCKTPIPVFSFSVPHLRQLPLVHVLKDSYVVLHLYMQLVDLKQQR